MIEDKMNCICCNQEKEVLISVETKHDSIFLHRKGVCQECVKTKDMNKVCTEFEIRQTKGKIKEFEDALQSMKDHLNKLREVK